MAYTILSFSLFGFFVASLLLLSWSKAHSDVTFDQYKKAVAIIDTIFAVYLAQVVASLFENRTGVQPLQAPHVHAGPAPGAAAGAVPVPRTGVVE